MDCIVHVSDSIPVVLSVVFETVWESRSRPCRGVRLGGVALETLDRLPEITPVFQNFTALAAMGDQ